jgi:hypothetical protein
MSMAPAPTTVSKPRSHSNRLNFRRQFEFLAANSYFEKTFGARHEKLTDPFRSTPAFHSIFIYRRLRANRRRFFQFHNSISERCDRAQAGATPHPRRASGRRQANPRAKKPIISGADPTDFAETTTCPLSPHTSAPGVGCSINVTFDPKATGSRSATLNLKDSVPESPQAIALGGTGQ